MIRKALSVSPTRIVALGFLLIILLGTILLSLPFASRADGSVGFVNALFTATSATCVTGLVIGDTWSLWTNFGQVVIITLIQIGGLGFMTLATVFSFLLRRRIGLKERLVMVQTLNLNDINGVVRLVRHVLFGTLAFETIGAVILTIRFVPDFGFAGGLARGVFHSISAFCNAGFDLMGKIQPDSSLALYATDPTVNIVIMTLVVIGGLGFFVWEDIYNVVRNHGKLGIHSRIVLIVSAVLLLIGWLSLAALEWSNPDTIGSMSIGDKLLASLFQSVTTRTAGFAAIPQDGMTDGSKIVSILLMFIGGSPGSTAGGVKTVTITVMLLSAIHTLRGSDDVNVFGRRISSKQVRDCMAVVVLAATLVCAGTVLLVVLESLPALTALFEVASAMATVGLTLGITPTLSVPSLLVLTVLMYLGRVGIMTIGIAAMLSSGRKTKLRFPEQRIMIG